MRRVGLGVAWERGMHDAFPFPMQKFSPTTLHATLEKSSRKTGVKVTCKNWSKKR
jgi:hypothetical protein